MTGPLPAGSERLTSEDQDFYRFIELIRSSTRIDLSQYKENQMRRRLTTLRLKHGFPLF